MKYLIAIDEGTTSTRAMLFDIEKGAFIKSASRPISQYYPEPEFVEEDAEEIFSKTKAVLDEMIEFAGKEKVAGIGVTNQRETVVFFDKRTGKPVRNAIVWQCRRTDKFCKSLSKEQVEFINKKTGLISDAYFSASKIKWALENDESVINLNKSGNLYAGTVDAYLIFRLTGNFFTDRTNASRTMLLNINTLSYDTELLDFFNISKDILPTVKDSFSVFGEYEYNGVKIPVAGVLGDQQSASFGQNSDRAGECKITYGTGLFMLMNTGNLPYFSKDGLLATVGAPDENGEITYFLEGSVFNAGSAVQWLRDNLNLFENSSDTEKMATAVSDNGGVYIVPAFTGLGAPYWKGDATGLITGITRGTNKNHIVRAVLESMAYSARELLSIMERDSGIKLNKIRVDGGASKNDFLMQFQSDVTGVIIDRPNEKESTSLGVIKACGIALKIFDYKTANKFRTTEKLFYPSSNRQKFDELFTKYQQAVKRCLL